MTEQERQMIAGLAERIRTAPPPQVDRDANDLIQRTIGSRPDALYILTQSVLIQQMALDQAKAQIEELQRQQPAPSQQGSFLPGGAQSSSQGGYQGSGYAGSGYSGSGYDAPQQPPPLPPQSRFSNFLHNAAQTAAGVVAGELAFDALSSIFGHRGGYYGGGGGFFSGGIMPGSETIVNNYYGDERGFDRGDTGGESRFAEAASQNQGLSPDIDDERDHSGDSFVSDDSSDSGDNFDDSSFDSGDDSGGSDF